MNDTPYWQRDRAYNSRKIGHDGYNWHYVDHDITEIKEPWYRRLWLYYRDILRISTFILLTVFMCVMTGFLCALPAMIIFDQPDPVAAVFFITFLASLIASGLRAMVRYS